MTLTAISPLDGRYATQVRSLAPYFSEEALIYYRVRVELAWLVTLSERPELPHIRPLTPGERQLVERWGTTFDSAQARRVKAIEATIGHDVKAVEYYLKERFQSTTLEDMREWVHFCCTSEDMTNLAYALTYTGRASQLVRHMGPVVVCSDRSLLSRMDREVRGSRTLPLL
jgi:adenylosuccinate lyase